MQTPQSINPVITFHNSQGDSVRGTLTNLQRHSLVIEIYNPYSIVQVSEVLSQLTVRCGDEVIYNGKGVVASLLNTGLMVLASVNLIDEWCDLNAIGGDLTRVGIEAQRFVQDWETRFTVSREYQVAVSELRAFLAETSRWADQADLFAGLPRQTDGRIRPDVFDELAAPIMEKGAQYLARLEEEGGRVRAEDAVLHHSFAQTALHPLLLRAPFVYRTFAKPLGYAGDYEMVNQILSDPRQGSSTYFQIVNTLFLRAPVAEAHRNRIEILVEHLIRQADLAAAKGQPFRVLNVACGPAAEVQRFIAKYPHPERLRFELLDFSSETLAFTRNQIEQICHENNKKVEISYVHKSVHELLKGAAREKGTTHLNQGFDFVYCAGLFDYLSDKVCAKLLNYFVQQSNPDAKILVTNVHPINPARNGMEHLLEWHLIYRDENQLEHILPVPRGKTQIYTDKTGVNVFAEFLISTQKHDCINSRSIS